MSNLTKKQTDFFNSLVKTYGKEALPSLDTIRKNLGFKSKNSIAQYIWALEKSKYIETRNTRQYIKKEFFKAPLFDSKLRAGFASVMDDAIDKMMSFDEELNISSPSVYIFRVSGDSMVDLGIFEGDYVSVRKSPDAKDSDIVLANVDGGFTLKTYRKSGSKVWLEPANPAYPKIFPKESLTIFGIATGIVRKL